MPRSFSQLSLAAVPADAHAELHAHLHADVWHAHTLATSVARVVATGEAALDAQLPGAGWPVGALTELLQAPHQHNEWRLLAPALARCGTAAVVLVGPPHVPFVPALAACAMASQRLLWVNTALTAQRLWATEQALRCSGVDAVLAWLPQARPDQLRRLQLAASEYNRLLFVMRPSASRQESSPAVLRLALELAPVRASAACPEETLQVHILKRRGPPLNQSVALAGGHPALARVLAAVRQPFIAPLVLQRPTRAASPCVPPRGIHALDRIATQA